MDDKQRWSRFSSSASVFRANRHFTIAQHLSVTDPELCKAREVLSVITN
jgi:hypothetical protein